MNRNKILAALLAVIMVISMLPAMVFAEGVTALDGKLKIKGQIVVGNELSANYEGVTPGGITDDDVSFTWSRLISEDQEPVLLGTERTYKVATEDLGYKIVLTVAGLAERGFGGSLKATSRYGAVSTADEASAIEATLDAPAEEPQAEEPQVEEPQPEAEEPQAEEPQPEEPQADPGEASGEELYIEDMPEGDIPVEDFEDYSFDETEGYTEDGLFDESNVQEENFSVPDSEMEGDGNTVIDEMPDTSADAPAPSYEAAAFAESAADDGTPTVDFGTIAQGTEGDVEAKYITIQNTGSGTLHFDGISPAHFEVGDVNEPLEANAEEYLYIKPRDGIAAGTYTNEEIVYTTQEGVSVKVLASVTVEESAADPASVDQTEEPIPEPEDPGSGDDPTPGPEDPGSGETPAPDPENPGEGDIPVPDPVKSITAGEDINGYSFGALEEGYTQPVAVGIPIWNDGNVDVALSVPVSDLSEEESAFLVYGYKDIADNNVLTVDSTAVFSIQPKEGLVPGTYEETLHIYEADTENVLFDFPVSFEVKEKAEELTYAVSLTPEDGTLDFEKVQEGYAEAPAARELTITNMGTGVINLTQPVAVNFDLGALSATTLNPGESAVISVRPKLGLLESAYAETIAIENDAQLAVGFTAMISVAAPQPTATPTATPVPVHKVVSVQNPQNIAGVANGAEKSAKGLGLPSTTVITTNRGDMKAKVSWDVKNCKYDSRATDPQSFTVSGQITLPDGVQNPDGVSLAVSVNVSVNAYSPKLAAAENNRITGISSDTAYDTLSRISFTAVGAGMDNNSPRKGDTRYVPLYWKVINTNSWSGAPYSATFGMAQKGRYTLSVVFDQQAYNGSQWANTGKQDTKSVVFNVAAAKATEVPGQTVTPAAQKNANQKNAVKTGDTTQIMPFIVILVIAIIAAAGAGIVIFRRKKK